MTKTEYILSLQVEMTTIDAIGTAAGDRYDAAQMAELDSERG